jgi:hypothetical protein
MITNVPSVLVGDVDSGGGFACVGTRCIWTSLYLLFNIAVNIKHYFRFIK